MKKLIYFMILNFLFCNSVKSNFFKNLQESEILPLTTAAAYALTGYLVYKSFDYSSLRKNLETTVPKLAKKMEKARLKQQRVLSSGNTAYGNALFWQYKNEYDTYNYYLKDKIDHHSTHSYLKSYLTKEAYCVIGYHAMLIPTVLLTIATISKYSSNN